MTKEERIERRKQWESRVAEFEKSSQGTTEWCRANNIKPHQLRYWIRKFRSEQAAAASSSNWLSVEVDDQHSESGLLVKVGQVTVEVAPGFNRALLADVVQTLKALC